MELNKVAITTGDQNKLVKQRHGCSMVIPFWNEGTVAVSWNRQSRTMSGYSYWWGIAQSLRSRDLIINRNKPSLHKMILQPKIEVVRFITRNFRTPGNKPTKTFEKRNTKSFMWFLTNLLIIALMFSGLWTVISIQISSWLCCLTQLENINEF